MIRRYFDANASTPPLPSVVEVMHRTLVQGWGNASSTHQEGQRARFRVEESRRILGACLGVEPGELVLCGTATEALHMLFKGLQPTLGALPAAVFPGEHRACLNPLRTWNQVRWLPEGVEGAATVVQMAASNETGVCFSMPQVPGAIRIKDCAQAWGKIPLDLSDCDAAVFSGHKMGGPLGAALLWMRSGLPWEPVLEGVQEGRRRGGTENVPALCGLVEAALQVPERVARYEALRPLRDRFETEVLAWSPDYEVLGRELPRLPNTSALLLRGHRGESIQIALDLDGFAVSTGSACHSGSVEPSHAVLTMGYSELEARSMVRVSMLPDATAEDVEALLEALRRILRRC